MIRLILSGSQGFLGGFLKQHLHNMGSEMFTIVQEIDVASGIDLCDNSIINKLPPFDCFIHLANLVYVPDSYKNPERFYRVNYLTTLNALEACRKNHAHLIYLSSYIYGQPQYLPVDENHPTAPFNPYAQSKSICEMACMGYNRDFDVDITILRPFNIFGEGQRGKLLIPEILSQIIEGKKEIMLKSASPKRDYVHVSDVARAIIAAISDKAGLNIYNVCSGKSVSVKEITEIINNHLKEKVNFLFSESDRPNEVNDTVGSYDRIEKNLGWNPLISFEEGIKSILNFENI